MVIRRAFLSFPKSFLGVLVYFLAYGTSEAATRPAYTEVFYPSGGLSIQAYLYKPFGDGPFPAVIYNHGSRQGSERRPTPFLYIGNLLTQAGYVALVVERRGYGRSDGATIRDEVGNNRRRLVARLQAETDDVLAARDYLLTRSFVDAKRIGVMGWSFGGIVTMFAVSRSNDFVVAVNQAGGALTWDGNADIRNALVAAAEKANTPTLLMVAQNDRTTESITTVAEIYNRRGVPHRALVYEPFVPQGAASDTPPGHRVFSAEGVHVWEKDVLEFLARYLAIKTTEKN
jgi:carboxymethylenebutenolidase